MVQQRPPFISRPELDDINNRILDAMIEECNNAYRDIFLPALNNLDRKWHQYKQVAHTGFRRKPKRSIISNTVDAVVSGITISNLVKSLYDTFVPWSDHNKLKSMTNELATFEIHISHSIDDFHQKFELQEEIGDELSAQIQILARNDVERLAQIRHLTSLVPKVSWIATFLQMKMMSAAEYLKITEKATKGQLATDAMSSLLNITTLQSLDPKTSIFHNLTRLDNVHNMADPIYRLLFTVHERSRDTFVYKVLPFDYWENLTGMPVLMKYTSSDLLIFNQTCMKKVKILDNMPLEEDCAESNYVDPQLNSWMPITSSRQIEKLTNTCKYEKAHAFNYIYCFPFDIVTKQGTYISISTSEHRVVPSTSHQSNLHFENQKVSNQRRNGDAYNRLGSPRTLCKRQ